MRKANSPLATSALQTEPSTRPWACIVVPFYRHAHAIEGLIEQLRTTGLFTLVVNDGSGQSCREVLDSIAAKEQAWLALIERPVNGGKGAATTDGLREAARRGFTHAVQIDADHQHDVSEVSRLLEISRAHPAAMVSGIAHYDDSVPRARHYGRYITHVWVWINTLSFQIRDTMCGLRVYPVAQTLAVAEQEPIGMRMEFDTEIMVRLFWRGTQILGTPTPVTYPADGVSHFNLWRDNVRISYMHARLLLGMLWRSPKLIARKFRRP